MKKGVEGSAHVDPDQDAHALDAMLNGLQGIQDRATGSDADTAPCKGASTNKADTPSKEDKGKEDKGKGDKGKGDKDKGQGDKPSKSKLHRVPASDSESNEEPGDILEYLMSTIMKDIQAARKIDLGLKTQPTQRYQCQALLDLWSRMNSEQLMQPRHGCRWSSAAMTSLVVSESKAKYRKALCPESRRRTKKRRLAHPQRLHP